MHESPISWWPPRGRTTQQAVDHSIRDLPPGRQLGGLRLAANNIHQHRSLLVHLGAKLLSVCLSKIISELNQFKIDFFSFAPIHLKLIVGVMMILNLLICSDPAAISMETRSLKRCRSVMMHELCLSWPQEVSCL